MPDSLGTLTDPVILFFALGLLAGAVRSNLEIPGQVTKFLSLYLLLAIGFKGGQALVASGIDADTLTVLALAVVVALVIPVIGYRVLRLRVNAFDAAAIAATYGSVSAVTFVAASQFLAGRGDVPGGHMTVALVLMETPAIVMAVVLANRARARSAASAPGHVLLPQQVDAGGAGVGLVERPLGAGEPMAGGPDAGTDAGADPRVTAVLRRAFTEGSFVLILGSLVVGALSGDAGGQAMGPFVDDLFKGMLALFLLEMGLLVSRQLREVRSISLFLVCFALVMPLVGAALAFVLGAVAGLPVGDLTLLMVLAASGSYIVVPAIARFAIPEALPARYLTMSLAVTFPFNIVVGIPLYHAVAGLVA